MIFKNMLLKELRQYRWLIWTGLGLTICSVFLVVLSYGLIGGVIKEVPVDIWEKFKIGRDLVKIFDNFTYYIWTQWNAKSLYQLGAILVIALASAQYAGENSKRNMGFLLSRPATRKQIFAGKSGAALIIIFVVLGVSTVFLWFFSRLFGYQAIWSRIFLSSLIGLLWLTVFYFLGSLFSILSSEPLSAGLSTVLAGIVLSIPGWFNSIRWLSIFYQMKTVKYFITGNFPILSVISAFLIGGLFYYLAQHLFENRDYF